MTVSAPTAAPAVNPADRTPADLLAAARSLTQSLLATPPSERGPLRAQRRAYLADAARLAATNPGDSDPDPDEALRRVRAGFGICDFCGKPAVAGHACGSLSPDGVAALGRGLALVEQADRDRAQTIAAQVEAAYAEYNDLPKAEYRDWVRTVAA